MTHVRCIAGDRLGLDEKRVRNELIKLELGIMLEFPSYREGLRAIYAGEVQPFSKIFNGSSLDSIVARTSLCAKRQEGTQNEPK